MAKWFEEGETTGLSKDTDEILQISLVDGNGETLLNTYVKPQHTVSWDDAQAIHGITPDMVSDAPDFSSIKKQVETLIRGADLLIGYNLSFDLGFVRAQGISVRRDTKKFDVMKEYAPVHGVWMDWKHDWKWAKLEECAAHYGHMFQAHNSLEDAKVTLKCFYSMLSDKQPGGYLELCKRSRGNMSQSASFNNERSKKPGKAFWALLTIGIILILSSSSQNNTTTGLIGALLVGIAIAIRKSEKRN